MDKNDYSTGLQFSIYNKIVLCIHKQIKNSMCYEWE